MFFHWGTFEDRTVELNWKVGEDGLGIEGRGCTELDERRPAHWRKRRRVGNLSKRPRRLDRPMGEFEEVLQVQVVRRE